MISADIFTTGYYSDEQRRRGSYFIYYHVLSQHILVSVITNRYLAYSLLSMRTPDGVHFVKKKSYVHPLKGKRATKGKSLQNEDAVWRIRVVSADYEDI